MKWRCIKSKRTNLLSYIIFSKKNCKNSGFSVDSHCENDDRRRGHNKWREEEIEWPSETQGTKKTTERAVFPKKHFQFDSQKICSIPKIGCFNWMKSEWRVSLSKFLLKNMRAYGKRVVYWIVYISNTNDNETLLILKRKFVFAPFIRIKCHFSVYLWVPQLQTKCVSILLWKKGNW